MRLIPACLLLAAWLAAAAAPAAAEPESLPGVPALLRAAGFRHQTATWTTLATTVGPDGRSTTAEARFCLDGDRYRMEARDPRRRQVLVLIDTGAARFLYHPGEGKALRWDAALEALYAGFLQGDMVAESLRARDRARPAGQALLDGRACEIVTYRAETVFLNSRVESRVREWIWRDQGLPLKSIVETPRHTLQVALAATEVPATRTIRVLSDLVLDPEPDPDWFALPPGTPVQSLTDLPEPDEAWPPVSAPETR